MTEEQGQSTAILLDDNWMTSTRVQKQLEATGYAVYVARVLPPSGESTPQLVLINLGSRSLSSIELITAARAQFPDARVLGFCGHLEIEIRRAAKAAGVEKILTNEQALSQLGEYL
jgi:DNA-binding NarL/FixJ family response regulator